MIFRTIVGIIASACVLLAPVKTEPQESKAFQLEYRDGTILTSNFADSKLGWTNVSELGQMTKQLIDVSRIESLTLTMEPASEQLAQTLKLINDLDSDDFFAREEAEKQLTKNGKRFRSLIERNSTLTTPDGIYRLGRILSSLKSGSQKQTGFALDILTLTDGTKLTGDAGSNDLQFITRGETVSVPRKRLAQITAGVADLKTRPRTRPVIETKLYHDHASFMENRNLKLVDFENKPDGTPLQSLDKNITGHFVPFGLKLGTEFPMGCVGVSGYNIKGGDKPVGGNSVCVYPSKTRSVKRFQGVMEITFCQPGKGSVPHGVNSFGLFLSRVNHSRDMLLQAYDSKGRLIGVCESNDEPCTFCGISSSVPIAKLRVLSNPWVLDSRRRLVKEKEAAYSKIADSDAVKVEKDAMKRQLDKARSNLKVDKDYAVDSIMYSAPVPVDSGRTDRHFLGRNGDVVPATAVRMFGPDRIEISARNVRQLTVSLDVANTVALKPVPKPLPKRLKNDSNWMAMLRDNSIVQWTPGTKLRSKTLQQELTRQDVVAIWPAGRPPRLPLAGDFERGNNVLVYPGCRVTTPEVVFDEKGFRWSDGDVLTEPLHEPGETKVDQRSDDFADSVAPRKSEFTFDASKLDEFELPTIWFAKPSGMIASEGCLRLDGGEMIVYSKGGLFELTSINAREATVTFGGNEVSIPTSRIISVVPPQE
ncbi:hypothetical protein [Mariniblastus fucicola]|uniref:Uncharacterized protein n=1 Tax=Mariniblastus fucicola TaxID=980251 RepID=A0A5B9P794_9BACT|nr:hypothetical protein [Mariniblastus fucicola]QEG20820.1 hypothetical protein MFFC18_06710 [Mariniblastus fucicola]